LHNSASCLIPWFHVTVVVSPGRFNLDIRRHFFSEGMVRHWHRLPREGVELPFLEVLRKR